MWVSALGDDVLGHRVQRTVAELGVDTRWVRFEASAPTGDETTFAPAIPTEVVEAVGAGDAFAAGWLAAKLEGVPAAQRLLAGHRRAHLMLQSTDDVLGITRRR